MRLLYLCTTAESTVSTYWVLPQRNVSISAEEIRRIEPEISEQQATGTPSPHRRSQVEVTQLLKRSYLVSHKLY
jgi:hypothetical protein